MRTIILGLLLAVAFGACKKERKRGDDVEKVFPLTNFKGIKGGDLFAFNVRQGAGFSIRAKGCDVDVNDLQLSVDNGSTLVVNFSRQRDSRETVHLDITLPLLQRMVMDGVATGNLNGFDRQSANLHMILNGTAKCKVTGLAPLLKADLFGASKLTVMGTATDLIATASGAAELDAYAAAFSDADVYASGTAKLRFVVQRSLFAKASGDSRVYYKGRPASVNVEQSGNGKVIHE